MARGRRQPGQRRPSRHVAARGAGRAAAREVPSRCGRPSGRSPSTTRPPGGSATALDRLKATLADPVGDRVVEGLRIAREVGGGDLGRLLRNLSGYLRDDLRTRSELESRQAWTVNGARLAVAAPWLVLLLLCFQPEVIGRYASPGGVVVLVGGAVCCLVAYRLMVRIGRLPDGPADPGMTLATWGAVLGGLAGAGVLLVTVVGALAAPRRPRSPGAALHP